MPVRSCLALLMALAALGLHGCAATAPRDALTSAAGNAADEDHLLIVAVENTASPGPPRPASTRPGYGGTVYRASDRARAMMRDVAREYGLTEVAAWPIQVLTLHCAVLRIPDGAQRDALLQRLSGDPRVKLAQAMNGFASRTQPQGDRTPPYNDPYLSVQRGFQSIDAAGAQQWSRGEKIRVAVIDTGIDSAHPDFGGRVVVRRNFVDRDARRFGLDRHGTAVAGVISASANNSLGIVGVAPGVEIVALKACWQLDEQNDAAHCNSLTLAQALAAAISENTQVVNLSLAGPRDPLLNALVAAGIARGMLYVGASPADASADGFPGGTPGVIPVDMAESAAARSGVLRAPGREVVTLMPGGRYDFVTGSSLATAHVSGAVALLLARDRRLDRNRVFELLARSEGTADRAASINACLALARLLNLSTCAGSASAASVPAAAAAITAP